MDVIYPLSYLVCLGGLVTWFITQDNKHISRKASAVFLFGFLVYLTALSLSSGLLTYKMLILIRDMVVLGIVTQLFNVFRKNMLASLGLGVLVVGILYFSYFRTLDYTFPQLSVDQLDASAEFLVVVEPGHEDILNEISSRFACTIERAFEPHSPDLTELDAYYTIDLHTRTKRTLKACYDWLYGAREIRWIEPNELMTLNLPQTSTSNVTDVNTHYLNDPEIGKQWGLVPMGADGLHRSVVESGIKPVKTARVVIIDTGIDATHEDIVQNYFSIDWEFDTDPRGHGTHCAGIAAAVSNNGIGIASLAPAAGFVEVSSIRALNASGAGTQKSLIEAMIRAVDNGADVLSMSLGGPSTQSKQKAYTEAVKYAADHGAIIVVAAGNNNTNARRASPANVKGVIVVTAIDQNDQKASFSNTVEDLGMGIAAPGVDIYSTLPGNKYGRMNGTSMATPYVAGLVGLLKSFQPDLNTKQVYEILNETGKPTKDGARTGPLIQPLKALERVTD